nr:DUF3592 domain-containing protein [Ruminococcus sp. YE71]
MSTVDLVLVLVPTLMTVSRRKKLEEYDYETDAEVTSMDLQSMEAKPHVGPQTRMWVPTFTYSCGGHKFVHKSHVGMTEKTFEVGQKVPIKVSSADPTRFVLVKSRAFTLATTILWIMAGFFIAGTIASAVLLNRLG